MLRAESAGRCRMRPALSDWLTLRFRNARDRFALNERGLPHGHQHARPERGDRGRDRDPPGVAVRVSAHVGEDGPRRSAVGASRIRRRSATATATTAKAAARATQAEGEGRGLCAQEHQERSDPRRRAQATHRDPTDPKDRRRRNAATGHCSDPGRVERPRAGHRRRRGRNWDRQRRRWKRARRWWRQWRCRSAASGDASASRARLPPRHDGRMAAARDDLPSAQDRRSRLRQRMHGRSRHGRPLDRFGDLQSRPRAPSVPARTQPKRPGSCGMVWLRSARSPLAQSSDS